MRHFTFFLLQTNNENTRKEGRQGDNIPPWLVLPLTLNGSHGVVLSCAWRPRLFSLGEDVGVCSLRESWRPVVGSTVPGCISPAHDSCDNSHLSIGDNDSSSLMISPSVTDIDLYWITASFDHIDLEIEEGVVHRRTWWKQLIPIGDPAHFG